MAKKIIASVYDARVLSRTLDSLVTALSGCSDSFELYSSRAEENPGDSYERDMADDFAAMVAAYERLIAKLSK